MAPLPQKDNTSTPSSDFNPILDDVRDAATVDYVGVN
jgi:hypothetical protein